MTLLEHDPYAWEGRLYVLLWDSPLEEFTESASGARGVGASADGLRGEEVFQEGECLNQAGTGT